MGGIPPPPGPYGTKKSVVLRGLKERKEIIQLKRFDRAKNIEGQDISWIIPRCQRELKTYVYTDIGHKVNKSCIQKQGQTVHGP